MPTAGIVVIIKLYAQEPMLGIAQDMRQWLCVLIALKCSVVRIRSILRIPAQPIDLNTVTASGKSQLRGMTVQRLRTYLDAYGIKPKSVLEKDDLIEAIIDARGLNGCLSSENEKFYRRYTIARRSPPDTRQRGANTSSNDRSNGPVPPQRPRSTDPRLNAGNRPTAQQSRSPPPPMPSRSSDPYSQNPQHNRPMSPRQEQSAPTWSPPRSPPPLRFPTPHHAPNTYPRPNSPPPQPRWQTRPQSPTAEPRDQPWPPSGGRSRSRSVPSSEAPNPNVNRPPPPPPPPSSPRPRAPQAVPLLATIVGMTREDLSLYNVATLKGILQANHVNARLILEKSELIDKVMILIETEMRERAREQAIHEAEERAMREQQRIRQEQLRAEAGRRVQETASQDSHPSRARSPPPPERPTSPRPAPTVSTGYVERDGLCVVCQDEEANVAIVDCGKLLPVLIIPAFNYTTLVLASPIRRRQDLATILRDIGLERIMIRSNSGSSCHSLADDDCSSVAQDISAANLIAGFVDQLTSHFDTRSTDEYPYLPVTDSLVSAQFAVASSTVQSWPASSEQPSATVHAVNSDTPVTFERTTFYATSNSGNLRVGTSTAYHSLTSTNSIAEQTVAYQNSTVNFRPISTDRGQFLWLFFIILPAGVATAVWLLHNHSRRSSDKASGDYTMARSDSSHTLTSSNSLGIISADHREDGTLDEVHAAVSSSSVLAPRLSSTEDFAFPTFKGPVLLNEEVELDRFAHLETAPFPSKQDLCSYVFPATGLSVEREIMVQKASDKTQMTPSRATQGRILTTNRFVYPASRTLAPPTLGMRSLTATRKRLSPVGDVLYSTTGREHLETVEEEAPEAYDIDTPKPTFNSGPDNTSLGVESNTVIFATSNSYTMEVSSGLRARRKSSPVVPSPTLKDDHQDAVLVNQMSVQRPSRPKRSSRHQRSVNTVNLESLVIRDEVSSSADVEDRKFTQFVKELVRRADELRRDRERLTQHEAHYHHVQIRIPDAPQETTKVCFAEKCDDLQGDYLAPPTSTSAHLSDFSSSSSISSDMVSSSSSSSMIGIAH
ncbi:SubName: Full=Uncharacterized protein {ECO:0000313/EMBL:CCA73508.1} [Serendipita indica DSM 11827]|nr:SubName: Full=Uncharacterized protein {ECO:0000313/EMBL:CCA73508.1} [Serendipita indica DSM 11827]